MVDGRSKKVTYSLRARRGGEGFVAVAGFPLRRQAPRVRGRIRLQHLHDTPESEGSQGKEGLRQGPSEPRQEHYLDRFDHSRRSYGRHDERRRSHGRGGLRSLRGALPGTVSLGGAGGGARWARGTQDTEGQGTHRGEGCRSRVVALLLAEVEPHRGGSKQDQASRA